MAEERRVSSGCCMLNQEAAPLLLLMVSYPCRGCKSSEDEYAHCSCTTVLPTGLRRYGCCVVKMSCSSQGMYPSYARTTVSPQARQDMTIRGSAAPPTPTTPPSPTTILPTTSSSHNSHRASSSEPTYRSRDRSAHKSPASARPRSYNPPKMVKPVVSAMNAWTWYAQQLGHKRKEGI
jgi:hypothetical protein